MLQRPGGSNRVWDPYELCSTHLGSQDVNLNLSGTEVRQNPWSPTGRVPPFQALTGEAFRRHFQDKKKSGKKIEVVKPDKKKPQDNTVSSSY